MFNGNRRGSVLTKDIAIELLQSPMDLYYRQVFLWFLLNQTQDFASDPRKGINWATVIDYVMGKDVLSRLHISYDYRIFLTDYNNLEIKMTPLPKALFLLFLRHPEGIVFKCLPDYREELKEIYLKMKPAGWTSAVEQSIDALTDPFGNSINEKCARIREAFVRHFAEHLAENYFITGKRGEPKKITLPRELVIWDK